MTICQVLECTHNNRLDPPECQVENEINDRGRCISFESDNPYITEQFRERHGYHQRNEGGGEESVKEYEFKNSVGEGLPFATIPQQRSMS